MDTIRERGVKISKWRPSPECLYVVGDVHGQIDELKLIFNRIMPLRHTDGVKDKLILLGDYIDRRLGGPAVIDFLIDAKKQYGDQLVLLKGNHEDLMMKAMDVSESIHQYNMWMRNGGDITLSAYLGRANSEMRGHPHAVERMRIKDFIPKEHIDFINKLEHYHETEDYIFVHGGCDPSQPLINQRPAALMWDRSLFQGLKFKGLPADLEGWDKTVVVGHSCFGEKPFIQQKLMMIDVSCASRLLVLELNSMQMFFAQKGKRRLIEMKLI